MTAIAAVIHRGKVWMAGDSRVSTEAIACTLHTSKVWAQGDFVIGLSGHGAGERVLRRVDFTSDWCTEIVRRAKELDVPCDEFDALIGHAGELWSYEDRSVYRIGEKYAATGSGAAVCLGYLAATAGVPPQDRVRGAVRAAILHVPTCGGKVSVVCA